MKPLNKIISCCLVAAAILGTSCQSSTVKQADNQRWVGTWGTAVQLTEPHNCPPEPGISGNTIRQKIRVSIGGETVRLKLSNEFGNDVLKIAAVSLAPALEGSKIDAAKAVNVLFGGKQAIDIEKGQSVISDALPFTLTPRMDVAVTIAYTFVPSDITGHPGSRTTSYILTGNELNNTDFADAVTTDHWYTIERLDVVADEPTAAIAIVGNSITDGRGSTTNQVNRWTDVFSERLLANPATSKLAVLNMGIGGNCIIRGGLGPNASVRFNRDVIEQPGVKYVIVFEGVNDIGYSPNPSATEKELIDAYSKMIDTAHAHGLKIFGATVTPFKECFYGSPEKEECRLAVNNWIRTCGKFDAVIDFEKAICSDSDTTVMNPNLHDNDNLHPNANGHKALGEFVDLGLFE
ncbi:MAG: SGNH/GDSL hydrolase family protein [Salinivirgaceae bacterium]|nr:SGNH/GDSL hydrolase family protein [Salinivirgaceae bacterium]